MTRRTTSHRRSLQADILAGNGEQMLSDGRLDDDDAAAAAMGMVVALYLGDKPRAIELATRVVIEGVPGVTYVNPTRDAAIILAGIASPDPQLASLLRERVHPDRQGTRATPIPRHTYDALLNSLETGVPDSRLLPVLVRAETDQGFSERWRAAKSLSERATLVAGFGRRRESVEVLGALLETTGEPTSPSYVFVESVLTLAARADDPRVSEALRRYFPLWLPGAITDVAPLAPVLDPPLARFVTPEDRRNLLRTARGGLPALPPLATAPAPTPSRAASASDVSNGPDATLLPHDTPSAATRPSTDFIWRWLKNRFPKHFVEEGDPIQIATLKQHLPWLPEAAIELHSHWPTVTNKACLYEITPRWMLCTPAALVEGQQGLDVLTGWSEPLVMLFESGFGEGVVLDSTGHVSLVVEGEYPVRGTKTLPSLLSVIATLFDEGTYRDDMNGDLIIADGQRERRRMAEIFPEVMRLWTRD